MTYHEATLWLAGLLEGEGTFGAYWNPSAARRRLRVAVAMTDLDVIEKVAAVTDYEGSITVSLRRHGHSTCYALQWASVKAEALMRRVLPYMGARRKAKIEECLALELSHHPVPVQTHCKRGHEWNEQNTRHDKNGRRSCRPCARERMRQRREAA